MLHGVHVIISTYGFWLPNDPRGSWSDFVRRWELIRFGKATKVSTRQSVASVRHDTRQRQAAKDCLKYPEVSLSGRQALSVGLGFRQAIEESKYRVHACSILPQHIHLVVAPHERDIRRIMGHFKARATQQLVRDNLHPPAAHREKDGTIPSPWARKGWAVYIFSEQHLGEAIKYTFNNPLKENKPRQHWSFVTPYNPDADTQTARGKPRH
jgi:REP element-mobilizing transposase RayT